MAKVGPLRIKAVVDPAFLGALERAIAAVEALAEQLNRHDLVTVELTSEDHDG